MSTLKRKAQVEATSNTKKAKQIGGSITSFFSANPSAAAKPAPTTNFNKGKWVASLTNEQKQLLQLEIETLHESWLAHLKEEITTPEFLNLKRFLQREVEKGERIFPPREDIYSWSRYTPFQNVKVVILGQDPYHNHNQAHGLAFSVKPPTPAPQSLNNIYKALKKDYPNFVPPPNRGGLLTPWAERGVLMLNTVLTVRAHNANSHANRGWEKFTQKVIDTVAQKRTKGVVFMAWGAPAAKRVQKLDKQRHLILNSAHPSPLSAHRGFFDCGHFRKSNDWLTTRYGAGSEIDWSLGVRVPAPAPKPARQPEELKTKTNAESNVAEKSDKLKEGPKVSEETEDEPDRKPLKEEQPKVTPVKVNPVSKGEEPDEFSDPSDGEEAAFLKAAEAVDGMGK